MQTEAAETPAANELEEPANELEEQEVIEDSLHAQETAPLPVPVEFLGGGGDAIFREENGIRYSSSIMASYNGWEHYFRYVVIPDLKKQIATTARVFLDNNGEPFGACLAIDGEAVITQEVFRDSLLHDLAEAKIEIIKGRAGGTAEDNACDAGMYYCIYSKQAIIQKFS